MNRANFFMERTDRGINLNCTIPVPEYGIVITFTAYVDDLPPYGHPAYGSTETVTHYLYDKLRSENRLLYTNTEHTINVDTWTNVNHHLNVLPESPVVIDLVESDEETYVSATDVDVADVDTDTDISIICHVCFQEQSHAYTAFLFCGAYSNGIRCKGKWCKTCHQNIEHFAIQQQAIPKCPFCRSEWLDPE